MNDAADGLQLYCDRLTVKSALTIAAGVRGMGRVRVGVLQPAARHLVTRALTALLRQIGVEVAEVPFFAGHLRTRDGESVYVAARRLTTNLALEAAHALVKSPALSALSRQFDPHVLALLIARRLRQDLEFQALQILVVEALAGGRPATVWLSRPLRFDAAILGRVSDIVTLRLYGGHRRLFAKLRYWMPELLRTGRAAVAAVRRRSSTVATTSDARSLLMLQEDELSMDRSVRTQPHWIMPGDAPPFPVYILRQPHITSAGLDRDALGHGVRVLSDDDVRHLTSAPHPLDREWKAAARAAAWGALVAVDPPSTIAACAAWRLLQRARTMTRLCSRLNVGAFLNGESHLADADAMLLVAQKTGIRTIAYQYSNLAIPSVVMMTTADLMVTFAPLYAHVWTAGGIRPKRFQPGGYVFDAAFPLLRARAAAHRAALYQAGARFIICYFDENVARDKFGLTSPEEHAYELRALAQLVIDDPSVGLIVKSQFQRNSPSVRYADADWIRAAQSTGRYLELRLGAHRNIVFPAEAALATDVSIGHAIGATAALEAACAGVRTILLNPYGMKLFDVYRRSPVVFDSIDAALEAITAFRSGEATYAQLGDWGPILPDLDPFCDGRAAVRLRRTVCEAVMPSDADDSNALETTVGHAVVHSCSSA